MAENPERNAAAEKERLAAEERKLAAEAGTLKRESWLGTLKREGWNGKLKRESWNGTLKKEALAAADRDAERKAKLEFEKLELEAKVEIERLRLAGPGGTSSEDHGASGQASHRNVGARTKAPVLPAFVDGKDNLDSYLLRFERYATVAGWDRRDVGYATKPIAFGQSAGCLFRPIG